MFRKMNELNNAKVVMCNVFRKSPIKQLTKITDLFVSLIDKRCTKLVLKNNTQHF
jgi:hypothetical protein